MNHTAERAAIYLRQSQDRSGEGLSIERQEEAARALCKRRGWEPVLYVENDTSAKAAGSRARFAELLEDVRADRVQVVVASRWDRLTRSARDRLDLIEACRDHGVLISLEKGGDYDLSTATGRMVADMLGSVAQAEIDIKAERQVAAGLQRAERGLPWGQRPFGYEQGGMVVCEPEAELIREAYREVLAGCSLSEVARRWNAAGVTTARGNRWNQAAVTGLLRSPRNAGLRAYNGVIQTARAAWPELVDPGLWRAVDAMLGDPARFTGGGGRARSLLTGLACCGICGATVRRSVRDRKQGSTALYRCGKDLHLGRKAADAEQAIEEAVIARLSEPDARALLVNPDAPDGDRLTTERADIVSRLQATDKAMAESKVDVTSWATITGRLRERLAEVDKAMAHTTREPVLAELVTAKDVRASWEDTPLHRRRAVLEMLADWYVLSAKNGNEAVPADAHRLAGVVALRWK